MFIPMHFEIELCSGVVMWVLEQYRLLYTKKHTFEVVENPQ